MNKFVCSFICRTLNTERSYPMNSNSNEAIISHSNLSLSPNKIFEPTVYLRLLAREMEETLVSPVQLRMNCRYSESVFKSPICR